MREVNQYKAQRDVRVRKEGLTKSRANVAVLVVPSDSLTVCRVLFRMGQGALDRLLIILALLALNDNPQPKKNPKRSIADFEMEEYLLSRSR